MLNRVLAEIAGLQQYHRQEAELMSLRPPRELPNDFMKLRRVYTSGEHGAISNELGELRQRLTPQNIKGDGK